MKKYIILIIGVLLLCVMFAVSSTKIVPETVYQLNDSTTIQKLPKAYNDFNTYMIRNIEGGTQNVCIVIITYSYGQHSSIACF
ncbi:MAG: hypothetical protein WC783_03380 [Candidatus Paceibacterota bacterium]|jgi:hypothetical protein